jgi:subtilisin family serine protease
MGASASAGEVSVLLLLDGDCLADQHLREAWAGRSPAGRAQAAALRLMQLKSQHAAMETHLNRLGARVTARITRLANALAVRLPEEQWTTVSKLPGVRRVQREQMYEPFLETSVPFVSVPDAWSPAAGGLTGEGIRIGIIDTGIDYLHADFGGSGSAAAFTNNNPTLIEAGSFPTPKVVGGYDFVGDDYDGTGQHGSSEPSPDPDPLDPKANGHGTHVASIAAGFGVLTNDAPFNGPYDRAVDFRRFKVGPGVAPRARLYALKVFGAAGSTSSHIVAEALDWAADPNQDGDLSDRLDVLNLSLGSPFGLSTPDNLEMSAVARLTALGCVVCAAAGNSGNTHFASGGVSLAPGAIAVANSIDDGAAFSVIRVDAPEAIAGDYAAEEAAFTPRLAVVGPVTAPVVMADPAPACQPLNNAVALAGRIAMIDRGGCYFVDKVRTAMLAGAVGVVVVNNVDGPPIAMGGVGDVSDIALPAVMISLADGDVLKARLAENVVVTLAAFAATARPELADQLNESSARGPALPDYGLKPEVAAPGTGILAAGAGSGTEGIALSGTSMASPHAAGAAALLRQAHPDWSVEDVKAALLNTAAIPHTSKGSPLPESRAGAGRMRVLAAAQTPVVAKAESANGAVALSFGALDLLDPYEATRELRVVNHGLEPASFSVVVSNTVTETGVVLSSVQRGFTVPAQGSLLVPLRLQVNPSQFDRQGDLSTPARIGAWPRQTLFEASGQVWLQSPALNLHLPWYVVVRALADQHAAALHIGVPSEAVTPVPLPTRGRSAHAAPLVSVFELGATSPDQRFPDERAATDLLAVGAASDCASVGGMEQARVFFGLVVAGSWRTPQRVFVDLDIEIDTNDDGQAEATLLNGTSDGLIRAEVDNANFMNDALITIVRAGPAPSTNYLAGGVLNGLDPSFRDTAPYRNAVLVHSAPATALGLSSAQTRFRYRAVTHGAFDDATPWARFDAARPAVDATPFGLQQTPLFDAGRSVRARVDRGNAAAAGYGPTQPLQALLLHQHNAVGQQWDLVSLDLATDDVDGDGLYDALELEQMGDLDSDRTTDRDRDGALDHAEFAAGTDPLDATSFLRLLPPEATGGPLSWTSAAGRIYALERAESAGGPFTTVQAGIAATPPLNRFTDSSGSGTPAGFYRVRLE